MYQREDYISWVDYFMGVAKLSSLRSKDPGNQIGCCIVDEHNVILSTGYNGFPRGISDETYNWSREDFGEGTKYDYVVHAELNAILNANGKSLRGAKLYTTLLSCLSCAKAIIQSGISKVYYLTDVATGDFKFELTKKLFKDAGIELIQLKPKTNEIVLKFLEERK